MTTHILFLGLIRKNKESPAFGASILKKTEKKKKKKKETFKYYKIGTKSFLVIC